MPRERYDGKVVYILGTSEPIEKKNRHHLHTSVGLLVQAGLKVVLDENVYLNHDDYQSGTPEQRLAALKRGLNYDVVLPTVGGYSITRMRRELVDIAGQYKDKGILFGGYSDNEIFMYLMGTGAWMPHIGMLDTWNIKTRQRVIDIAGMNKYPEIAEDEGWDIVNGGAVDQLRVVPGGLSQIRDALTMGIPILKEPCALIIDTNDVQLSEVQRDLDIITMNPDSGNIRLALLGRTPGLKGGDYKIHFPKRHRRKQAEDIFRNFVKYLDVPGAICPWFGHSVNALHFFPFAYNRLANFVLAEKSSFKYSR